MNRAQGKSSTTRNASRGTALRFFIGFRETSGYLARLADGLATHGANVTYVDLSGHPFAYGRTAWWSTSARFVATRRRTSAGLSRTVWRLAQCVVAAIVAITSLPKHDVYILASLPPAVATVWMGTLRFLRKRVILVLHGSECRPPYLNGFDPHGDPASPAALAVATRRQKAAVATMERWASIIVSHDPYSHFLEQPFVSYMAMGFPAPTVGDGMGERAPGPFRILHAPSKPAGKGSSRIVAAVGELMHEGLELEFAQVSARPHAEVMNELARCDMVIDQLFSDQPMPGFATEAAAHGKPVVIGGYEWTQIKARHQAFAWPPTVTVDPERLGAAIRDLVADAEARRQAGEQLRQFATELWSNSAVAARYIQLAEGSIPAEWLRSPSKIRNVHGCGLSREESRARVRALLDHGGPEALCVSDKPDLLSALIAHASRSDSVRSSGGGTV